MIIGIVAAGKNWEIGKKNGLLFKLPGDMKFFRSQTEKRVVVMGYNTLLSLPNSKPLKNRVTIVLCPEGVEPEGCIVYHDFTKMVVDLQLVSQLMDIYVCGGAMLYSSMLPYYDKVLVTRVDAEDSEATAFFPNLDEQANYELVYTGDLVVDNGYKTSLCEYVRR